ncbi:hypothetical protein [Streptomyces silvensis]|uniref:WXG100 family type VII secretion target n=1 Tax=Streptomyces silvensis TaxID=1765722 RepID=A0A0W7X2K5_9ACTN|nr:hypothetical protein [Streptomyces silvensis]KUF17133.1 hypothetical protein AT728_14820 [Streptomyces silvensis]
MLWHATMGCDQEGARTRADATERRPTSMRLDQTDPPGPPPGGAPDLATTPRDKRAAAHTIETELQPDTRKAGDRADAATDRAISGFGGWATADGLKKVRTTWDSQVKTLMRRLDAEKGALRSTNKTFTDTDLDTSRRIGGLRSRLDQY